MTLDKFGRHIEHHKTKKYINAITVNLEVHRRINKVENFISSELSKIKQNLRCIAHINLHLQLNNNIYSINKSDSYIFPYSGKILEIRLTNDNVVLNYSLNKSEPIFNLINKNIVKGDELQIHSGPLSINFQQIYMEILLETPVYYVEN